MRRLNVKTAIVALSVCVTLVAASGAHAGSGGMAVGGTTLSEPREGATAQFVRGIAFGVRPLREGMRGTDVRALHGIVKAVPYGHRIGFPAVYNRATKMIVRRFQRESSIVPTGRVDRRTARQLIRSMDVANATWYGSELYGNSTACGQTYGPRILGVAHKTLPCGTPVTFRHRGRTLVTRVIDRGPFVSGIEWDLSNAARLRLGFDGSGPIRYVVGR